MLTIVSKIIKKTFLRSIGDACSIHYAFLLILKVPENDAFGKSKILKNKPIKWPYYELLKPNETITGALYRTQLMRLSRALKEKRAHY